ncbi:MAG: glycosyltransferase [Dehalococcoidia bacterium]|nr:MAG: glycosyltransferase [Dehalococcoidia bacterium]
MAECVLTHRRSLSEYTSIVGEECIQELRELAKPLCGARVLHLNATAAGGGVAEILKALVPLMCDLELNAEWCILQGADEFYKVTKAMHNGLQGMPVRLKSHMKETWLKYNSLNADLLNSNGTYDFVVVHDPQPAGVLRLLRQKNGHRNPGIWIWRCHLDLSTPRPSIWRFLKPYVDIYDAAIFTKRQYFPKDFGVPRCFEVPPGIDPLSIKNRLLDDREVRNILLRYGVDPGRPFIFKVSRFDPWKDFCGVIDIYDLLRKEFPEVQLVLVGGGAGDDPEAWSWYQRTAAHAQGKGDIHILWGQNGVGSPELNAFHQAASVVVQKSIRDGFGLVVAEALWKGCPVVASDVGGIALQISHRETGFLVRSVNEWVEAIAYLLRDSEAAGRLGSAGRRLVQEKFLITRNLRDYLRIFQTLTTEVENA